MTREEKKTEAIARMRKLNLIENVIQEFITEDKLNISINGGFLYWLDEQQKSVVKDFEKEYDAVVYHVIGNSTNFGELLSLLYVSDHEEEWEYDNDDIRNGYPIAYVKNLSDDGCSEFGTIGIRQNIGGLVRFA